MDQDTPLQKFIVIISALIVFTIGMMIGINIIGYFVGPSANPYVVKGLIPGNTPLIISQDPNVKGSIPIERADNQEYGLEFSWAVWLNISDLGKTGEYQHIFHKGDNNIQAAGQHIGMNFPNNAPGLYLAPNKNELVVIMNTFTTINEEVRIPNIPLNKWLHVIIRVENSNLDIYINGSLAKRHVLGNVAKQNYGNVNVGLNGGFSGFISNLRYHNYSISPGEIISIVDAGPNLTVNSQQSNMTNNPPYLSLQWYVQNPN
jgi:hypothetical protein